VISGVTPIETSSHQVAKEWPHGGHSLELFAARLMEFLVVPAFVLNASGKVIIWNKACERLTATPASEVIGTNDHWKAFYEHKRPCLADLVLENRLDDIESLYASATSRQPNSFGVAAENWCVMPRVGHRLYMAIDVGAIHDEHGSLVAVVETLRDMTAQKSMELELQELAGRDPLTGLANRRMFDLRLKEAWARWSQANHPASLMVVDIDKFKKCNDKFGHPIGDQCLKAVADRLLSLGGATDCLVSRIGGDEFAVIIQNIRPGDASDLAERVRREVETLGLPDPDIRLADRMTLSIGIASSVDMGSADEWMRSADTALYRAKKGGRNCVATFEAGPVTLRKSA
jgi:diguanylate cyclase (GGDEF)-like protein